MKSLFLPLFSHALCKYDVFLFGFLSVILKPYFFPDSGDDAIVTVLAAFAAGYMTRPLGALFFSHIGDTQGRKKAFLLTVLFMLLPTLIIGSMPGYHTIGQTATILILLCRFVQGFGSGGEFCGIAVYSVESAPRHKTGYVAGLVRAAGFYSTAIGIAIASFLTLPSMPSWAWRGAFFFGGCVTLVGFLLRHRMRDSQVFEKAVAAQKIQRMPALTLFRKHKQAVMSVFFMGGGAYTYLYVTTIYMNTLYDKHTFISISQTLMISSAMLLIWAVITPIAGALSDRMGVVHYLRRLAIGGMFLIPFVAWLIFRMVSLESILMLHIFLSIYGGMIFAPYPTFFKKCFPVEVRYSGAAFSNTMGQALIGGTSPLVMGMLSRLWGDALAFSIVYIVASMMILGGLLLVTRRAYQRK